MHDKLSQTTVSLLFASDAAQLITENKLEEALSLCETGVRNYPFYAPGHYILALCYQHLGQKNEAKNEFERVLIYDPSHKTAMRKLSENYAASGLQKLADDLLIKEALYSPMDSGIMEILKEKGLYENLTPHTDLAELKTKDDDVKVKEVASKISDEEGEGVSADGSENPSDDSFDNIDPLARETYNPKDPEEEFENEADTSVPYIKGEAIEGYGLAKKNYLNSDDDEGTGYDEWMEVENLLGEENFSKTTSVDEPLINTTPPSEVLKNDTELLLEELKNAEIDDELADSEDDVYDSGYSDVHEDYDSDTKAESPEAEQQYTAPTEEQRKGNSFINDVVMDEEDEQNVVSTETIDHPDDTRVVDAADEVPALDKEEEVTIKDLMNNPNLVTPTFGEILIAQQKFKEALHVFIELNKKEPENQRFLKKIEFLNKFLQANNI